MKINICWGDVTHISAQKKALHTTLEVNETMHQLKQNQWCPWWNMFCIACKLELATHRNAQYAANMHASRTSGSKAAIAMTVARFIPPSLVTAGASTLCGTFNSFAFPRGSTHTGVSPISDPESSVDTSRHATPGDPMHPPTCTNVVVVSADTSG